MTVLMYFCELNKTNLHTHARKGIPTSTLDRSKQNIHKYKSLGKYYCTLELGSILAVITDYIRFYFVSRLERIRNYSKKPNEKKLKI